MTDRDKPLRGFAKGRILGKPLRLIASGGQVTGPADRRSGSAETTAIATVQVMPDAPMGAMQMPRKPDAPLLSLFAANLPWIGQLFKPSGDGREEAQNSIS